MVDILKDKSENKEPSWFGYETWHIWQKEARALKAKLGKALQPKVIFDIDTSKYDMPYHNPYRRYNYVERVQLAKEHFLTMFIVIVVTWRVILLPSATLGDSLSLNTLINGCLNTTKV